MNEKITNKHYKEFLKEGIISTINRDQIDKVLANLEHPKAETAKKLILILFMTGARPKEALLLKPRDFTKEGKYLKIRIPAVKKGITRTIFLQLKDEEVQSLYDWTQRHYPELLLFWPFISEKKRTNIKAKLRNGVIKTYTSEYHDTTNKLYYWFKQWFSILDPTDSYSPYFLRHNHFSRLSEKGASMQDIMMLKGAKSMESVRPYLHMSTQQAKKIAKMNLD